jgi:hypothetical protein
MKDRSVDSEDQTTIHRALANPRVNGLATLESFPVANRELAVKPQAMCMSSSLVTARPGRSGSRTTTCVGSTTHGAFVHPPVNLFLEPEASLSADS